MKTQEKIIWKKLNDLSVIEGLRVLIKIIYPMPLIK